MVEYMNIVNLFKFNYYEMLKKKRFEVKNILLEKKRGWEVY